MDDECLSLTWNNHGATYRHTLSILREENTLTDVTLACDGQKFAAHKLVLVTCSDYFRTILGDIPCQHPIVYMRGVAAREMQALIDFMYTGQTDIPQKEVPTLLSTAEALQIKGLGVFTASEYSVAERVNPPRKEKCLGTKKRRFESPVVLNGSNEESIRGGSSKHSVSKDDNFLENLYSHHYALASSPKRRKTEEKTAHKTPEYVGKSPTTPFFEKSSPKETSAHTTKDSCQNNASSLPSSVLSDLVHHRQPDTSTPITSTSPTPTYSSSSPPPPQSLPQQSCKESLSSHNRETARQRILERHPAQSPSSQQPLHDPRPEAKTASPRALNYSLAGLGGSKEEFGIGSLGHMFDESNSGLAETPEKLMKAEIKEEALDFSSTTLSENLHGDSISSALNANSIEEETRMYLDAFARSANLSRQHASDDALETASVDGRPFMCPICQKCFAKAAILKRHHLAHFRPYVCHLCTRSFTRREVLAEHLLEHNGADLRMPCPVCSMTIKRKRNLQAHIKVKHPDYYREKIANRQAMC